MKLIKSGNTFKIYGDDLQTFDKLPAGTYKVQFGPMSGFYLEQLDDFVQKEEKIYGNHLEKISKVLRSYQSVDRSLGVILSGNKGMGKSLFTQLLAQEVIKLDLPVIMVAQPFPGIADFLDSIDQECLVIFDEFEKVFSKEGGNGESQNALLGLFDGTSQKKRLYAITVNELSKVSDYMVSRPGRFHYHLRFDYPTADEIEIYLKDKLSPEYYSEIRQVIAFANRVNLNYDSLRAIAFELNQGYSFSSAISDLNILMTDYQRYDLEIKLTNGEVLEVKGQRLNLFNDKIRFDSYTNNSDWYAISFKTADINYGANTMTVDGKDVEFRIDEDTAEHKKGVEVASITIELHKYAGVNYNNLAAV